MTVDVDRNSPRWWWVIVGAIAVVSGLHYATSAGEATRHVVYERLYFLPVALAALVFGLRGGLLAGLLVGLVYGVVDVATRASGIGDVVELALDLGVLMGVGTLVGHRVDRERHHYRRARYAERLAALGEASAVMAHEIKRPLATIGGFARSVLRRSADEQDRRKLEIVAAEVLRLERLVHNALDYARERPSNLTQHPVWEVLDRALEIVQPEAEEKCVKISLRVDRLDGQDLWCDGDQVQQVLINLLDNAVKHAPRDGSVWITASPDRPSGVVFEVKDSGPGIPEPLLDELFKPFSGQREGGTGLGLAISQRLIHQHGSKIEVVNHPHGGASFRFSLPAKPIRDQRSGLPPDAEPPDPE